MRRKSGVQAPQREAHEVRAEMMARRWREVSARRILGRRAVWKCLEEDARPTARVDVRKRAISDVDGKHQTANVQRPATWSAAKERRFRMAFPKWSDSPARKTLAFRCDHMRTSLTTDKAEVQVHARSGSASHKKYIMMCV